MFNSKILLFNIFSIIPTLVSENFLLSIKIINLKFKQISRRNNNVISFISWIYLFILLYFIFSSLYNSDISSISSFFYINIRLFSENSTISLKIIISFLSNNILPIYILFEYNLIIFNGTFLLILLLVSICISSI